MSNDDKHEAPSGILHYEGGIPVFNARLDEVERKQTEAEAREEAYKKQQLSINKSMMWFTGMLVLLAIITAGINGLYTYVTKTSADAAKSAAETAANTLREIQKGSVDTHELAVQAKNQADATKAAADTSNRAMVLQDRPWVGKAGTVVSTNVLCTPNFYKYQATFINFGHSPALNLTTEMEERVFEKFPAHPPYSTTEILDRAILFPGVPLTNQGADCHISDQDSAEVSGNPLTKKHLYIYGRIFYDDHIGTRHHTFFCVYTLPRNALLAACPTYNDAD